MLIEHLWFGVALCCLASLVGCASMSLDKGGADPFALLESVEQAVADGKDGEARRLARRLRSAVEVAGTPLVSGDTATFLIFTDDAAESVRVLGPFSESQGNISLDLKRLGRLNVWVAKYRIPSDAEFLYNIEVNNEVAHDPLCKRWIVGFGKHSVGRMPDFDPWVDRAIAAGVPHGTTEVFDVQPKALEGTRTIQVHLPPGYGEGNRRYPVLYVHDGPQALADGRLDRIADYLLAEGRIQPLILCFVPPKDRMQDYGFNAEGYASFLAEEVVPVIDGRYRTLPDRHNRGVTGASMGGRISTYLVLHHTDVFGVCIGQSSYFEKDSQILQDLREHSPLPVRFYYDVGIFEHSIGDRDLVAVNRELRDRLDEKGCEVNYREWPGVHCWLTWSRGIGEALPLFWPPTE